MNDTIFAPATAPGRGAVAVVRLSGPRAGEALVVLTGRPLPPARRASLRPLHAPGGEVVDEAVVLWWPGPRSYTGEDAAELHLHGGSAVLTAVLRLLADSGLRLADPGEFTRRAFVHGRLDLTQAEGVADLVDAETEAQRRQALAQLGGALSARYEAWRGTLLDVLAMLEAGIDFPDEEIPADVTATARSALQRLAATFASASADAGGERVRQGVRVALIGAPNVGKSSLLNALLQREAAIVTPIPGTTRDVVEGALVLDGQLALLADTAGLRATSDLIEAEGVRRAEAWARTADLRIGVVDSGRMDTLQAVTEALQPGDILVLNKSDLGPANPPVVAGVEAIRTSVTGGDIASLRACLTDRVRLLTTRREFPAVTNARHRSLLDQAAQHLQRGLDDFDRGLELAGENVRLALAQLERVAGRSDPDAVLDRVFARFCIGK